MLLVAPGSAAAAFGLARAEGVRAKERSRRSSNYSDW